MLRKLAHYFTALFILIGMAAAYNAAATQWLRPPVIAMVPARQPTAQPELKDNVRDLFAPGDWQLGECRRLLTPNGTLLFNNWQQTSDYEWKLWPITLIVGRGFGDDQSDEPLVLTAEEGAELLFSKSFDMTDGSAPPIQRGRMLGKVSIKRRSKTSPNQSLALQTSNVGIDNQKIWTTETIKMTIGSAMLIGQNLTIKLASTASRAAAGQSDRSILDSMELVYLKQLDIPLDDFINKSPPTNAGDVAKRRPAGTVSINCDGMLLYDFLIDQLSVRDKIELLYRVPGEPDGRFSCDQLDLVLRDPINSKLKRDGPMDWLDRFKAVGNPAAMDFPSQNLQIVAEEINFDAINGWMRAHGSTGVQLRRGAIGARLSRFEYLYRPDRPEELGTIDAQGAGIVTVDDPNIPVAQIRWRDGCRIEPQDRTSLSDLRDQTLTSKVNVFLDGAVFAKLTDGGEFHADSVQGVFQPGPSRSPTIELAATPALETRDPSGLSPSTVLQPLVSTSSTKTRGSTQTLVPDRVQATGNVSIDSRALEATANAVYIQFKHLIDPFPPESGNSAAGLAGNTTSGGTSGSVLRQWVGQPQNADGTSPPVSRPRPSIHGDQVSVMLQLTNNVVTAQDLSATGGVELHHTLAAGDQMLRAKMSGDQLRMIDGGGADLLQLGSGPESPARFELGDGYFVGPMIRVWPSQNQIRIDGAGEFMMPTAVMPASLDERAESRIQWVRPPHCQWNGDMQFDGRMAVLTGGVQIKAALIQNLEPWAIHVQGQRMEIDLSTPVDVQQTASMQQASISQIRLIQGPGEMVVAQAEQHDQHGQVLSRHEMLARQIFLEPSAGGNLLASGPGSYRGWMLTPRGASLTGQLGGSETTERTKPSTDAPVLNGLHLTFHHSMRADLGTKMLSFLGGVRAGLRELDNWEQSVDVRQMEQLAVGESTLDCNDLRFGISPDVSPALKSIPGYPMPWEMEAVGGVLVKSRDESGILQCTAGRASYASQKGRLIIQRSADASATISQRLANGKPGPSFRVSQASIDPKTLNFNTHLEEATIGTLPGTGNR
ncbi:hypothetical protein [Stieleria varia]|uniref:OstA-like protein n=1 Tax=Stieleria varia TaxID=2528005 RepID=A0A5C6ATE8_9BACT|nr:hypothetical protein [Stieleria varia]TWU02549.1 hypothetical protein Pla52n_35990 [Stieleria varia]